MKSKEKLIKFMREKDLIIFEKTGIRYFLKEEEKYILNWNDNICDRIWDIIEDYISWGCECLPSGVCPFCIYFKIINTYDINRCSQYYCEYELNHGKCMSKNSTYNKLRKFDLNFLSNSFYENLIKKIGEDE